MIISREAILRIIMVNMIDADSREARQLLADTAEEIIQMDKDLEEAARREWETRAMEAPCTTATLAATDSTSL